MFCHPQDFLHTEQNCSLPQTSAAEETVWGKKGMRKKKDRNLQQLECRSYLTFYRVPWGSQGALPTHHTSPSPSSPLLPPALSASSPHSWQPHVGSPILTGTAEEAPKLEHTRALAQGKQVHWEFRRSPKDWPKMMMETHIVKNFEGCSLQRRQMASGR